ncbi:hypothetical protein SKAU_G00419200 [Synaphobranchus kaupii]|uniref:Uncharacterized protein n=1 Tax=Synaphobranchus kaupii TaxID=118154 RepID=A0A9Q1E6A2_SYNKA|nr:hypothetical protein SKAU_G00419200 [Synaphobranchus kaupii]
MAGLKNENVASEASGSVTSHPVTFASRFTLSGAGGWAVHRGRKGSRKVPVKLAVSPRKLIPEHTVGASGRMEQNRKTILPFHWQLCGSEEDTTRQAGVKRTKHAFIIFIVTSFLRGPPSLTVSKVTVCIGGLCTPPSFPPFDPIGPRTQIAACARRLAARHGYDRGDKDENGAEESDMAVGLFRRLVNADCYAVLARQTGSDDMFYCQILEQQQLAGALKWLHGAVLLPTVFEGRRTTCPDVRAWLGAREGLFAGPSGSSDSLGSPLAASGEITDCIEASRSERPKEGRP